MVKIHRHCNGEDHWIGFSFNDGNMCYQFHNHSDQEVDDQLALAAMGAEVCACVKHMLMMQQLSEYFMHILKNDPGFVERITRMHDEDQLRAESKLMEKWAHLIGPESK